MLFRHIIKSGMSSTAGKRTCLNVQGHRFYGSEEVENTIMAIKAAAASQLKSIETDVLLTKDDKMVICHGDWVIGNAQLRPLDNPDAPYETKVIGQMTLEELSKYGYQSSQGHAIPTLDDVLDNFKGTDKILNIELKDMDARLSKMVIDAFVARDMLPQLFLSSFYHYHRKVASDYLKEKGLPHVRFGYLAYSIFAGAFDEFYVYAHPGDEVTVSHASLRRYQVGLPALLEKVAKHDMKLNIWFDGTTSLTYETLDNYRDLFNLGIHTVITNHPSHALELNAALHKEQSAIQA